MSNAAMIDLLFVAVVFAGVMYWIFVAPVRSRRKRHQVTHGRTAHSQAWDPNIGARKRER